MTASVRVHATIHVRLTFAARDPPVLLSFFVFFDRVRDYLFQGEGINGRGCERKSEMKVTQKRN